jgi:hypothetical protein
MNRLAMLPAAFLALALSPAALAKDDAGEMVQHSASGEATGEAPVRLVSWDGDFELMKTSRRMRVWRSHLAYRLTVDAEGNVTGCELTESFRLKHVTDSLCDVLSEHHHFEPAQNAAGEPVEGSYSSRIAYADVRDRLE